MAEVSLSPTRYEIAGKRVWVAGHTGMVGSALVRKLAAAGASVVTVPRAEIDLRRQGELESWMERTRPQGVIVAAATVGGILANNARPADFLYDNLMIEANIIHASHIIGVEKLLFLGSSCIYPKLAPQPMSEAALLTGPLEPTNEWYAIAKIAGIKLCQAYMRQHGARFISAMPTNLYGPNDNFDLATSHVMAALIRKFHEAKASGSDRVLVLGTGRPRREFLHVDDLADALMFLLQTYEGEEFVNIGVGEDLSISQLAQLIARVVGYEGRIEYDPSKPDGTPQKLLDVSRMDSLGWKAKITLEDGLASTYRWFVANGGGARRTIAALSVDDSTTRVLP